MTDPGSERRPDPRPEPRWGQYAEVPPAPAEPEYPPPSIPEPAPAPRRTGDIVFTTLLLLIGVYDVVVQWPFYAALGVSIRDAYEQQVFGEFTSIELADSMGATLNLVRAGILVIAIAWALLRISRGKRGFWIALGGGVLAALVAVGFLFAIMFQDPALMEYVRQTTPSGN